MTALDQDRETLKDLRKTIIEMVHRSKEGHIPSAFSILEILYTLYKYGLRYDPKNPLLPERDYFILSKGHACSGLYPVLAHFDFFDKELLKTYCKPGSIFGGHPDRVKVPGIEVSSGSLGHGVAMGAGIALGLRHKKMSNKVVVLVGDGEAEEGSFWESVMMVKNNNLSNILIILDYNHSQKYSHNFAYDKIMPAFDWDTFQVEGHDVESLRQCLEPLIKGERERPAFVIANTTKGYGINRFIGDQSWHRRSPTDEEMPELFRELDLCK